MNGNKTEIEIMLAHQERQIQELNDIVTQQAADIEALKKYVKMTKEKLQDIEGQLSPKESMSATEEAAANKPPHY